MTCKVVYDCGCIYIHNNADNIQMLHACTDHKIQIYKDALVNYSKRVKLGTST